MITGDKIHFPVALNGPQKPVSNKINLSMMFINIYKSLVNFADIIPDAHELKFI